MRQFSVSQARRLLPSLADEVVATRQEIMITRRGKPLVKLVACEAEDQVKNAYPLRGLPVRIADDFDAPLTDLWEALTP